MDRRLELRSRELIERCEAIRHVDSLQPEFSMLNREHAATGRLVRRRMAPGSSATARSPSGSSRVRSAPDTVFPPGDWRTPSDEPEDPDEVDLFSPDRFPAALEAVAAISTDRRAGRRHDGAARAGVERGPARGDVGDRRQPEPRSRAQQRGRGRRRARRGDPGRARCLAGRRRFLVPAGVSTPAALDLADAPDRPRRGASASPGARRRSGSSACGGTAGGPGAA